MRPHVCPVPTARALGVDSAHPGALPARLSSLFKNPHSRGREHLPVSSFNQIPITEAIFLHPLHALGLSISPSETVFGDGPYEDQILLSSQASSSSSFPHEIVTELKRVQTSACFNHMSISVVISFECKQDVCSVARHMWNIYCDPMNVRGFLKSLSAGGSTAV